MNIQNVSLGELAKIQTGKLDANASSDNGAFPFFTCAREPLRIDEWKYDLDAILIAGNGDLNVKHYNGKFDAYQRTYIVSVEKPDAVDSRYLFHFMDKYVERLREQAIGGIIKYIKLGMLTEAKIPLPTLEEQKRIAGILDQADALCRLRTRALDKLITLGQAMFHHVLKDARLAQQTNGALLGDAADFYSGNTVPEGQEFTGQNDGYLILKVSDLNRPLNSQNLVEAAAWTSTPGSKASTCPAGAIVFPKRGGAIGTNKKRILTRPAILDPNLMGVVPHSDVMTISFLSGWFAQFNLSDIASGSSVPQLNKKDLAPLELDLPAKAVQERYELSKGQLDALRGKAELDLKTQVDLFAGLQHRAFRGEL